MIPTVDDIWKMLERGECSLRQARSWLDQHAELDALEAQPSAEDMKLVERLLGAAKADYKRVDALLIEAVDRLLSLSGERVETVRLRFDGPPGPVAGRFVEAEDASGASTNIGEWSQDGDYWILTIRALKNPPIAWNRMRRENEPMPNSQFADAML